VNVLERIVAQTRTDVAARRAALPLASVREMAEARGDEIRPFREALARRGMSVIAEHKRRSPSAGTIRADLELSDVVQAYERAGAAALSILTDGPSFGGELADLGAARETTSLPLLRKDFVVDSYQVYESLAFGADALLLIVAALERPVLERLLFEARSLGLAALVEVHDERELAVAADVGADMIGVNNRDLTTLTVDVRRTFELLPSIPDSAVRVAESGFSRRGQIDELAAAGVDAVLVGEALMRSPDIESACRALVA
jgi:indole-3-glycerol phosphate synthase